MQETRFLKFWHSTLRPGTSTRLATKWHDYVLSGVQRGYDIVNATRRHVDPLGCRVLDVGCGYGGASIAFALAGSSVTGVDISDEKLRGADIRARFDWRISNILFARAVSERLPLADMTFDIVVCADVLEHVESQEQSIAEISRVVKPGGYAFLSFPNRLSLQNLCRDPHYGLSGISILPPSLAAWYIQHVRHLTDPYQVGYLPIASALERRFQRHDMAVVWQNPTITRQLGLATAFARTIRKNMYPLVEWIVRKD